MHAFRWTEMKNKAARAKKPLDEDIRVNYSTIQSSQLCVSISVALRFYLSLRSLPLDRARTKQSIRSS
jgi:hypothetical protein